MTAIIPAAGKGTRFLPLTRAVPKEMLPIGAKPAIHCIVEEAIAAGADDIVVIISDEKEIIHRYFEPLLQVHAFGGVYLLFVEEPLRLFGA